MWKGSVIVAVVPAYCEETRIGQVIASMPEFVDRICVVDDASLDGTSDVVRLLDDPKVHLISLERNRGVGGALASGYVWALSAGADVMVVLAGDAQMDPVDLLRLLEPVIDGDFDYVKGNRFLHRKWRDMPAHRRSGSRWLAGLTRWATGLTVDDSQCG